MIRPSSNLAKRIPPPISIKKETIYLKEFAPYVAKKVPKRIRKGPIIKIEIPIFSYQERYSGFSQAKIIKYKIKYYHILSSFLLYLNKTHHQNHLDSLRLNPLDYHHIPKYKSKTYNHHHHNNHLEVK